MSSKIFAIIFILLGLFVKSQEYKTYDFEKQVRYIFNDSAYTVMEVIANEMLPNTQMQTNYWKKEVIPLKFILWKNKNEYKKVKINFVEPYLITQEHDKKYEIPFLIDFDTEKKSKNGAKEIDHNSFTSYSYQGTIKFNDGVPKKSIEYFLKTFSIEKKFMLKDEFIKISKKFSSKSQVFAKEFIENCEQCNIDRIIYFNKTTITARSAKTNKEQFNIDILDLVEKGKALDPIFISRKINIIGDKSEALNFLGKNKLDYQEVSPEKINVDDFTDL